MKLHIRKILVLVLTAAFLLAGVQLVAARGVHTTFHGTEVWVSDISPGTETFPDENLYHIRDAESIFDLQTSDPRVSGEDRITLNANFRLVDPPVYVTGKMWGKFRITNSEGYWKGTWIGVRDRNGFSYIKMVGTGGGNYKGMRLWVHIERLTPDPTQPETVNGFIIE
jgi:hypothetical protein